uniref:Uncharacterized protein n=1 Tax=Knipowitschia caucasica TaxID=637954 RepID=A0AAV2ME48_KNICA
MSEKGFRLDSCSEPLILPEQGAQELSSALYRLQNCSSPLVCLLQSALSPQGLNASYPCHNSSSINTTHDFDSALRATQCVQCWLQQVALLPQL